MLRTSRRSLFLAASVVAAMAGYCAGAAAQSTALKPGDELRPLYATSADVTEGKRLADQACAGCHGGNGISANPGVPNLAGQRPAYLYLELKAYQAGVRSVSEMTNAIKFLSDDALVTLAAYFDNLDPPPPASAAGSPAAVDPVEAGKAAAAACLGCHGDTGVSKTPGMPSLVALDPKYLVAAMKAYRSGQRKNDLMKAMVASLSDATMGNIALFYGLQKPERAQTPAAGDPAAGAAAAAGCAGCHGDKGVSGSPNTPSLAGQDAQYLAAALRGYKDGSRSDETMKGLASALDETAIQNIPAYYAAQQPQPLNLRKPLTAEEWAQRCDRCHGVNGNSTDPRRPALASQRLDYLEKVLHAYRTGARKSPEMAAMADVLGEDDVRNLAAYYAGQRARGAVFITVPCR
jgi:cytochrome c553